MLPLFSKNNVWEARFTLSPRRFSGNKYGGVISPSLFDLAELCMGGDLSMLFLGFFVPGRKIKHHEDLCKGLSIGGFPSTEEVLLSLEIIVCLFSTQAEGLKFCGRNTS